MIRLKKILSEIETERGDLNQYTGVMLFNNVYDDSPSINYIIDVYGKGFKFVERTKEMNKLMMDAAKKNSKMPMAIQKKIIKSFGKVIRSTGDIFITLNQDSVNYDNGYHMFDFSKPVRLLNEAETGPNDTGDKWFETNFYVGHVKTENISSDFYYSPKKQLGLSNIQQVHLSEIGREYRGQGYGSMLYDAVASSVDAIYSDDILYKGSLSMWTKHIRKRAKFFGAILSSEDNPVIVPISGEINKKVIDAASGFVSIFNKVPPKLIEMQKFLFDTPLEQIYVSDFIDSSEISMTRITDALERNVSLVDFDNAVGGWGDMGSKYTAGIFLHGKATFVVKEVGDELDYMIL